MEKIDFVIPWVDSNDPNWLAVKNEYLKADNNIVKDSSGNHRYRGIDILKYVMRSIEYNCPWYNKIYLITAGHYPSWLNINHPKVELVTHKQLFFNEEHLPTFSSRAIEMNLANLKQLSDKFVHFNDDTMVFNPIAEERFFRNGKPVDCFAHGWIPRNKIFELLKGKDIWVQSLKNNISLVNRDFYPYKLENNMLFHSSYPLQIKFSNFLLKNVYKRVFWISHWHLPQPYLKSTIKKTYQHFSKEMMICSSNRFRKPNDVNPYLYRYTQLLNGDFVPEYLNDGISFQITNLNVFREKMKFLEGHSNINLVCFNDSQYLNNSDHEIVKEELQRFLTNKFPRAATFELI